MKVLTFINNWKHCYSLASGFWKTIDSLGVGRDIFFPILLIYPVTKLDNVLQNSAVSWICKNVFCNLKSNEVSNSHNCTCCPKVINYPVLPKTEGFLEQWTITAKTEKVSSKLGWVGTSQSTCCPNLDTELSSFTDLTENHLLTISWPTFLVSFLFPHPSLSKEKIQFSLLVQRGSASLPEDLEPTISWPQGLSF